jgi:hypothetical protein
MARRDYWNEKKTKDFNGKITDFDFIKILSKYS